MSVDEQLLGRSEQAAGPDERSGHLRQSKRKQSASLETSGEESSSLREAVLEAKREKKKKEAKEETKSGALSQTPMRKGTSAMLRQAWMSLAGIVSFPLALIWINIHAFLRMVVGEKFFCKLGDEWTDAIPAAAKHNPAAQKGMKTANTVEKMGLGCFDGACCLLVIIALGMVALILLVFDPLENLGTLAGFAWKWLTNAVGLK